ncbi:MAG: hypothetical protein M3Q85_06205 [Acidobacteriota bacterium]|nr:hypothetical protein [Acidobacteriota bacterium]
MSVPRITRENLKRRLEASDAGPAEAPALPTGRTPPRVLDNPATRLSIT